MLYRGVDSYTDFETAMYRIQPLPLMDNHGHGSGPQQDLDDEQMFHIFMDLDMPGLDTARAAGATNSSEAPPAGSAGRADSTRPGSAAAAEGMHSIQSDYEDDDEEQCNERSGGRARGGRSTRARRRVGRAKDEADLSSDEEDDASGRGGSSGSNKRVMANRQSAQRSRMRKLQFISDLEANVQSLENDIKSMNPMHSALRQKHAELVSQHDEMRKHAVSLVHKCRQAESVNAALDRECSRMRSQRPELIGRGYGMGRYGYGEGGSYGNRYGELQTSGSAPTRPFDRYGSSGGMQGGALAAEASAEPCAHVSSAGVLQVSLAPTSGGQPMKEHHSIQHRPNSAPIGYGQMYEGGSNYSPIYMHAPEPVPY
ncbi:g6177 [Coccomyxa elongata]